MTTETVEIPTMEKASNLSPQARVIAKDLLNLGAIKFNFETPFKWVSGIESPIYCDMRLVNSYVIVRDKVIKAFVEFITDKFPSVDKITGVVTGGVPFSSVIADKLNLPSIYVRQQPKEHGLKKQIEGMYKAGEKVIVIEDHISTGKSSIIAINALKEGGLNVLGLISIMTYKSKKASDLFKQEHVNQYSLCDLDTILDVALTEGKITSDERNKILEFRDTKIG